MGSFDPIAYFFAKKAMKIAIPKLSLLEIDVDKDWSGKRITNVGAPLTSNDVPRARAEDILSGVFSPDRIPNLDAGKITSGIFDIARIPDLDASKIVSGTLNPERIPSLLRAKISDFWDAPFWPNIPDKPNVFPPEAHVHERSEVPDFWSAPFWDNIPDKPTFVDSVLIERGFYGLELGTGQDILFFKLPAGKTLKVWGVIGWCHAAPPGTPGEPARFHAYLETETGETLDMVISAKIGELDAQTYVGNPLFSYTAETDTIIYFGVFNWDINYPVTGSVGWIISCEIPPPIAPPTLPPTPPPTAPPLEGDYSNWTIYDSFDDEYVYPSFGSQFALVNKDETKILLMDFMNATARVYDIPTKTLSAPISTNIMSSESIRSPSSILNTYYVALIGTQAYPAGICIFKNNSIIQQLSLDDLGLTRLCSIDISLSGKYIIVSGTRTATGENGWVTLVGS